MPIQAPQWTEYLSCPVCANGFELKIRLPISLGCGHTICKTCLSNLQRHQCPFDQCNITIPLSKLPVNTALILLLDSNVDVEDFKKEEACDEEHQQLYTVSMKHLEKLAVLLRPSNSQQLSRPMQRKLVSLINCQPLEEEGRARAVRAARSLGERSVTELILQHQNPQQLSANLWAAVRTRGCQFLGPAMQEEVLKLVLLALEDGSALSRKVLVMFVVQRLEPRFPQASKTSIGHVVQLLYRASCFKVTKREGDSSLMQLKEEFRTYETLRREHDAQIVQIATEAGLRIAPDQWSSLLYGDSTHKSHMQSIIDKLQTPQSFLQSVQELVIALQRTGDPGKLSELRGHLDLLSGLDPNPDVNNPDWNLLNDALVASEQVVLGLLAFMSQHSTRRTFERAPKDQLQADQPRYKTSMCRDLSMHGSCPRGKHCTFAHSSAEMDQFRNKRGTKVEARPSSAAGQVVQRQPLRQPPPKALGDRRMPQPSPVPQSVRVPPLMPASPCVTPVAQVAPVPRGYDSNSSMMTMRTPTAPQPPPTMAAGDVFTQEINPQTAIAVAVPAIAQQQGQPMQAGVLIQHPQQLAQLQVHGYSPILQTAVMQPVQDQQIPEGQFQSQQLYFHTLEDVNLPADFFDDESQKEILHNAKVATKSLSALRSRKEEIIENLQDIVGEEETKKISERTAERATTLQKIHPQVNPQENASGEGYCMWTSRVFTPVFNTKRDSLQPSQQEQIAPDQSKVDADGTATINDDMIPWSETPQISRFGPICRRSGPSVVENFRASQTQAVIDDAPQPTPVVTNSKHMARPAPPIPPAILHQNGAIAQLQPVAVGLNGEIEFIVVPQETSVQQQPMDLRHLHTNSAVIQQSAVSPNAGASSSGGAAPPNSDSAQSQNLFAESQRMKHELEILQQKISSLNLAKMESENTTQPPPPQPSPSVTPTVTVTGQAPDQAEKGEQREERRDELTQELQLIENTILDRQLEISINHQSDNNDGTRIDYGSYVGHGMMLGVSAVNVGASGVVAERREPTSIGITTIARSGQAPRTNGRFFDPF